MPNFTAWPFVYGLRLPLRSALKCFTLNHLHQNENVIIALIIVQNPFVYVCVCVVQNKNNNI
jgi:hypothetical protein